MLCCAAALYPQPCGTTSHVVIPYSYSGCRERQAGPALARGTKAGVPTHCEKTPTYPDAVPSGSQLFWAKPRLSSMCLAHVHAEPSSEARCRPVPPSRSRDRSHYSTRAAVSAAS